MDATALLRMLREFPDAYWRSNSNASMLMRQAARALVASRAPQLVLAELRDVLRSRDIHPERCRRLLVSAFAGILEQRSISRENLVALLRGQTETDALSLLEVWLDFQPPTSPARDLETATAIMKEVTPDFVSRDRDPLALMVVRLWAHRTPPLADAMLFAANYEHTTNEHLLAEGARILQLANPGELHRRLIQFSPVMAKEAGQITAASSFSPEEVVRMSQQMSQENSTTFLENHLHTLNLYDPRDAAKFAPLIQAKDAAVGISRTIIQSLVQTGDLEGVREWIATASLTEQGRLWDEMVSGSYSFDDPSASAALFYLQNRPGELPPNFDAVASALGFLPYRDVLQYLDTAKGEIKERLTPLPRNIVRKEIDRLRKEDPERISAFIESLPPDSQSSFTEEAFHGTWDGDAIVLSDLSETSTNPAVRATARQLALKKDLKNYSLSEVQSKLLQYLAASPGKETLFSDVVVEILRLQPSTGDAIAFLANLPTGELKDGATVSFAKTWSILDPVAAADWIAELPVSKMRDQAISAIISSVRDDPERALANAAGIQDPKLRFESARTILRLWRDIDPSVADAAIATAGFSPEDTASFRAMVGRGPEGSR